MSKIDLIIPVYKAYGTIFKTLSSVVIQSVENDINVIMVVDNDGYNYDWLYHKFENRFANLTIYYLSENGGPAVARQYGIEKGTSPYIMFLDADDTFGGAFAVESLLAIMEREPKFAVVSSAFYEKRENLSFVEHRNDMTWLHGKIYRRSFIEKYDVRFNKTRANEDVGFNTKIKLLENENEKIYFTNTMTYYWHWNKTGITRVNNFEYTYDQSYVGYVQNQIDAIQFALNHLPNNNEYLIGHSIEVLANIYMYLLRIRVHRPELEPRAWDYARDYYNMFTTQLDTKELLDETFNEIVSVTIENQLPHLRGHIVDMTFHDFLNILEA
jgi:glycosyltransferase involved in cell wall biosynthesis